MFARIKKSGKYQYLQIVENTKEDKKVKQGVIATIGRMDRLEANHRIETLIRSLSRYSENVLLVLSGKSDIAADSKKIGPALIFERLWKELGIQKSIKRLLKNSKFEFDVERAIFLTVMHRLMNSGSDRSCDKWHRDYVIKGADELCLHHLYRAMGFLGEEIADQKDAMPFAPRCRKDQLEEDIFFKQRELFSGLDLVFFDTTSIYFEGKAESCLRKKGFSKDHRPDLNQMVVGVVIDDNGKPICCEMWPGNTADVKTLIPIIDRIRKRFKIARFCIVADRGMISAETVKQLEAPETGISYILGVRMRKVKQVKLDVVSGSGKYIEVYPEGKTSKDPSPLKVKEVKLNGDRYVVCLNPRQARKDANDRETIIEALKEQIKKGPKTLIGNKGYRKYLKIERGSVKIDIDKAKNESRFGGKWVLKTNISLSPEQVALKYKELWQVERVFRDVKTILETRPIFHSCDDTIRGHVFCSFLALVLRKELESRLELSGHCFEWADIKQDIKALQEITIEENGKRLAIRSQCKGICGKVFQSVGVAIPSTIREV
jgi:transposase